MLEDPAINDAALEEIIPKAIKGDQETLNLLMAHPWMQQLFEILTRWALKNFNPESYPKAGSVQGIIYEKLLRDGPNIKNESNRSWRGLLKSWCFSVIGHYYLNQIRDLKVVLKHEEQAGESPTEEPCSTALTPEEELLAEEEELLAKEEKRLWKERGAEVRRRLWLVINSFPPKDARVIRLWVKGKNLRQIEEETGIPLSTVDRREKKIQKALVQEIRAFMKEIETENNLEEDKAALEAGLMEMVAHILREMGDGDDAPRIGACT